MSMAIFFHWLQQNPHELPWPFVVCLGAFGDLPSVGRYRCRRFSDPPSLWHGQSSPSRLALNNTEKTDSRSQPHNSLSFSFGGSIGNAPLNQCWKATFFTGQKIHRLFRMPCSITIIRDHLPSLYPTLKVCSRISNVVVIPT